MVQTLQKITLKLCCAAVLRGLHFKQNLLRCLRQGVGFWLDLWEFPLKKIFSAILAVMLMVAGTPVFAQGAAVVGTLSSTAGSVTVNGVSATGGPLVIGSVVAAGPNGSATITFIDGCTIKVNPGTTVTVGNVSPCALAANEGKTPFGSTATVIVGGIIIVGAVAAIIILNKSDSTSP